MIIKSVAIYKVNEANMLRVYYNFSPTESAVGMDQSVRYFHLAFDPLNLIHVKRKLKIQLGFNVPGRNTKLSNDFYFLIRCRIRLKITV